MTRESQHAVALQALEEQLLSTEGRASRTTVEALLADEFVEFGSSGAAFGKQETIDGLAEESADGHGYERAASDWMVRDLAVGVALVTYRVTSKNLSDGSSATSLRSSIWKHVGGRWRMVFHQGTRVPKGSA
jgi:hypothetical protein